MIPYLKHLFTDEKVFVGLVRAALMIVGFAVEAGKFPLPDSYDWLGFIGIGVAMFMRSSTPTKATPKPQP